MIGALGEKLRARVTAGLERARPVRERLRRRRLRRGSGDSSGEPPSSAASTPRRVRLEATPEPPGGDSRRGSTAGDMTSEGDSEEEEVELELYRLHVHLRHGRHLPAMDSGGTSDPYVKFKLGGKVVYKSAIVYKTLNPTWDERFSVFLQDPYQNLHVKAYDHDWGVNDDFLGEAPVDLCALELDVEQEMEVPLYESESTENGGLLTVSLRLQTLTPEQIQELAGAPVPEDEQRPRDTGHWSYVLHVMLVEARGLLNMDAEDTSDPYVKFRLGKEKYKSRVVCHTLNPEWLEPFELYVYGDVPQPLEMELFDHDARTSDDFLGRCALEVGGLAPERTHDLWLPLEDGTGSLRLLVTLTGATVADTCSDPLAHREDAAERLALQNQFGWQCLLRPRDPVGHLTVRVFKARGLAAADITGRSDPYCVLQLCNQRRHTQTAYKTLNPHWNKIFTFDVGDIHTVLKVTVWDQDQHHQAEFLGRLHIPLLEINSGQRHWYPLKNLRVCDRAKGADPQILLQLDLVWNQMKGALRSFLPREKIVKKKRPRFKTSILTNNINRMKACTKGIVEVYKMTGPILRWESPRRTVAAFIIFLIVTFCFELYMLPPLLLFVFVKGLTTHLVTPNAEGYDPDEGDDEDEEENIEKDDRKTLREKLQVVQEVATAVQTVVGDIDSLAESAENLVQFAVPFVSWLAVAVLVVTTCVLYYVPLRVIVAVLGCRVFAKQLIWPGSEFVNDVTNFLSCVPDHHQRNQRSELPPLAVAEGSAGLRRRQRDRYRQLQEQG